MTSLRYGPERLCTHVQFAGVSRKLGEGAMDVVQVGHGSQGCHSPYLLHTCAEKIQVVIVVTPGKLENVKRDSYFGEHVAELR